MKKYRNSKKKRRKRKNLIIKALWMMKMVSGDNFLFVKNAQRAAVVQLINVCGYPLWKHQKRQVRLRKKRKI